MQHQGMTNCTASYVSSPLSRRIWMCVVAGAFSTVSFFSYASEVENIRVWRAPDHTRLVLDLTHPVEHKVFTLSNPDRVVIDIDNAKLKTDTASLDYKDSPISNLRTAVREKTDLRVVLDLANKVTPRSFVLVKNAEYSDRLVIDLYDSVPKTVKTVQQATQPQNKLRDIVVAIDAGHGGDDPGAIGHKKIKEKDVVLKIAKELEALLKRKAGYQPFLVRKGDYYVSLSGRTDIAHDKHADLFVSIHADAFKDPQANGASVYAVSQKGSTSAAAKWLADRENRSDLIGGVGGVSLKDKDKVLASVLLDLSSTASLRDSLQVGSNVLSHMDDVARLHRKQVEQAGFAVLKSPDIPSILVETGFITNPSDSKKLATSSFQKKMANSIYQGVIGYFNQTPPPGTYLAYQKQNNNAVFKHTIARGDTLSAIARKYQVTVSSIRKHNGLSNDAIKVGQVLQIPSS